MEKINEYLIVQEEKLGDMISNVNTYIGKHYQPFGSVFLIEVSKADPQNPTASIFVKHYCQPFVKVEEK